MSRAAPTWWRGLSDPQKFRLYTRLTLQVATVGVLVPVAIAGRGPWSAAGMIVSGLAGVAALEAQPALATRPDAERSRWVPIAAGAVLGAVWVTAAVVAATTDTDKTADAARVTGASAAVLAVLAIVSFSRYCWWWLVAVCVATGVAFHDSVAADARAAGVLLAVGVFVVGTMLLTLWGLRVVDDLDRARGVEARLQVAEERLRFSRDLHDVVGRGFSAIAVKSELAAALTRAGNTDRAAAEMDEVKSLAVDSMGEMRKLVHRYRDIDLVGEVAGARSLLSAAGCTLTVEGDAASVPGRFHEVAAWVVREGTTNIVKHSSADAATLTLGAAGMSLSNALTGGEPRAWSGLRGLAERLDGVGAKLEAGASGDRFVLEVLWEAS